MMRFLVCAWVAALAACGSKGPPLKPWKGGAVAHGGVGSPPSRSDGCRKAVDAALQVLDGGGDPLDAAVAGVVVMEDDPRFNAGTGAKIRLDGRTIQMDASVMDSTGRFGAVAVIERVKNPVKVARLVADSPHRLLAGDGATRFARAFGFPDYDPATDETRAQYLELKKRLLAGDQDLPKRWMSYDWRKAWNYARPLDEAMGGDTVGVVVRAPDGRFAGALSTGGWVIALNGRVGDVPIRGAGLYVTADGGAAATGAGELIIDAMLTRDVVDALRGGASAATAARRAVDRLRGKGIGIIVASPTEMTADADANMAWAARVSGSTTWQGPKP